jgi:hypothetical protein
MSLGTVFCVTPSGHLVVYKRFEGTCSFTFRIAVRGPDIPSDYVTRLVLVVLTSALKIEGACSYGLFVYYQK